MAYHGLLVATCFPPFKGGIQNYLYSLYGSLPHDQFKVLSSRQPGCQKFDPNQSLDITRVGGPDGMARLKNLFLLLTAAQMVEFNRLNEVHCGVVLPDGLVGYELKRLTGKPYVVYTYAKELYTSPKRERRIRKILRNADKVVTISRFTRRRLVDLGVDQDRIVMIPPGVDVDLFAPKPKDPRLVSVLGLEGKKVILSAGRQVERKGTDTVIKALPEIVRSVPNATLVIAGQGDYLSYLRKLTRTLAMENHVKFVGSPENEEMPDYYSICDVFTMVNRTLSDHDCEGFGIVFLEAGACARPVIGGNSGGAPDAVVDGKTGFLANPWDAESVAALIIRLLSDTDLARQMGEAGREWVVREFGIQKQAGRLAELIGQRVSA